MGGRRRPALSALWMRSMVSTTGAANTATRNPASGGGACWRRSATTGMSRTAANAASATTTAPTRKRFDHHPGVLAGGLHCGRRRHWPSDRTPPRRRPRRRRQERVSGGEGPDPDANLRRPAPRRRRPSPSRPPWDRGCRTPSRAGPGRGGGGLLVAGGARQGVVTDSSCPCPVGGRRARAEHALQEKSRPARIRTRHNGDVTGGHPIQRGVRHSAGYRQTTATDERSHVELTSVTSTWRVLGQPALKRSGADGPG